MKVQLHVVDGSSLHAVLSLPASILNRRVDFTVLAVDEGLSAQALMTACRPIPVIAGQRWNFGGTVGPFLGGQSWGQTP